MKIFKHLIAYAIGLSFIVSCAEDPGKKPVQQKEQDANVQTQSSEVEQKATFSLESITASDENFLGLAIEKTSDGTFSVKHTLQENSEKTLNNSIRSLKSDEKGNFTEILTGAKKAEDKAAKVGTDVYYSLGFENYKKSTISDVGLFSKNPATRAAYIGKDQAFVLRDPRAGGFFNQTYIYSEQKLEKEVSGSKQVNEYFTVQSLGKKAEVSVIPTSGKRSFLGNATGVYFENGTKYFLSAALNLDLDLEGNENVAIKLIEVKKYKVNADNSLGEGVLLDNIAFSQLYATTTTSGSDQKYNRAQNKLAFAERAFPASGAAHGTGVDKIVLGIKAALFGTAEDNLEIGGAFSIRINDASDASKNQFLVAGFSAKVQKALNVAKFLDDSFVREYVAANLGTNKFVNYTPLLVSSLTSGTDDKKVQFGGKYDSTRLSTIGFSQVVRDVDSKLLGFMFGKSGSEFDLNMAKIIGINFEPFMNRDDRRLLATSNRFDYASGSMPDVGAFSSIPELSRGYVTGPAVSEPFLVRDPNTLGWNHQTFAHIGKISTGGDFEVFQSIGRRTKEAEIAAISANKTYKGYLTGKFSKIQKNSKWLTHPGVVAKVKDYPGNAFGSSFGATDDYRNKAKWFDSSKLGELKNIRLKYLLANNFAELKSHMQAKNYKLDDILNKAGDQEGGYQQILAYVSKNPNEVFKAPYPANVTDWFKNNFKGTDYYADVKGKVTGTLNEILNSPAKIEHILQTEDFSIHTENVYQGNDASGNPIYKEKKIVTGVNYYIGNKLDVVLTDAAITIVKEFAKNNMDKIFKSVNADDGRSTYFKDGVIPAKYEKYELPFIFSDATTMAEIVGTKALADVFKLPALTQIINTTPPGASDDSEFIAPIKVEVNFATKAVKISSSRTYDYELAANNSSFLSGVERPSLNIKETSLTLGADGLAEGEVQIGDYEHKAKLQLRIYGDSASEVGGVFGLNQSPAATHKGKSYIIGGFGAKVE